jgi:hypothetical protein
MILQPLLRIFTKGPTASIQTVLHVLFLPTPFKILSQSGPKTEDDKPKATLIDESLTEMPEEVLKPGALYSDCAVVKLKVPVPTSDQPASEKGKGKDKGKEKATEGLQGVIEIPDDGEFGGELTGRLVWEAYEEALKAWEKANPPEEIEGKTTPPGGDREHEAKEGTGTRQANNAT